MGVPSGGARPQMGQCGGPQTGESGEGAPGGKSFLHKGVEGGLCFHLAGKAGGGLAGLVGVLRGTAWG